MKKRIKAFFNEHPGLKIKSRDLAKQLELNGEHEYAELKHFLFQLSEEEFLEKIGKRYQLKRNASAKLVGTVQIVSGGDYGFVALKNSDMKDVFIPSKHLGTAFDGDFVEINIFAQRRGKNIEGEIVNIIERGRKEIVGMLKKSKSFFFIIPDDDKIHRDIYIPSKYLSKAKPGDKVVVSDIEWKSPLLNPEGKVKEVLGKAGTYDAETASIAREFGLTYKFPKEVNREAESIPEEIPQAEIEKRLDLRAETIFTIDPDDAKDFDDAVSVTTLYNGNFRIGIHIADVSHYVAPSTALYAEALNRATSVYLVGKVIPMLPEKLSNNVCSLVPNKDRLTYSVIAEITERGKILNYHIKKSIINSKRRFTYDEVQNIIDAGKGEYYGEISLLNKIAKTLRAKRLKKGSIDFHTHEVIFTLDEYGVPIDIKIKESKESHNLIEELMLLANQVVASHIKESGTSKVLPFVYRVHDLPDREKLFEFSRFVKSLGYAFDPNSANKSKEFQKLLDGVKGTEEEAVINEVAIRSMAKAVYSTKNIGHYGLGFKYYTHFTSPIRRFPDLIVHNLIHGYIENGVEKNFSLEELNEICNHSSAQERNAVNAERLSIKLKQIEFLRNKIGEEFHAVVSGIMHFGIFVQISNYLAEGLIRLRDLDDDYYIFDEKNYSVLGKRSKRRIRLGDKLQVRLIRVDEEKREVDFMIIDD